MGNNSYQALIFEKFCKTAATCLFILSLLLLWIFIVIAAIFPVSFPTKNIKSVQFLKTLNETKLKAGIKKNIKLIAPIFCFYSGNALVKRNPDGEIFLWLTSDMLFLPEDEFAAVAAHEFGHLVSGHVDDGKSPDESDLESIKREQAEADAWAIKWVGRKFLEKALTHFLPKEMTEDRLAEAEKILKSDKLPRFVSP